MANHSLYTVGGTVQAETGLYIPRLADKQLLTLCQTGAFAYVLAARQMGKSGLMVRTANQLMAGGVSAVIIDLNQLGAQVAAEAWYLGLLTMLEDGFGLETDVIDWWQRHANLGQTQRLVIFFKEVLLAEVSSRLVIFIDEIDATLNLPFADDFFAAVRAIYNARATTPEFKRLSFVLIGVATPGELIDDPARTPFNIGQQVDLNDFTFTEARPFAEGLGLRRTQALQALAWTLKWTGGHPYLTQRLCYEIAKQNVNQNRDRWSETDIDRLVESIFLGERSGQDHNLQFVRDMLTKRAPDLAGVLSTYRTICSDLFPVPDEEHSPIVSHLKLSGVVRSDNGVLRLRNPIYAGVFDRETAQADSIRALDAEATAEANRATAEAEAIRALDAEATAQAARAIAEGKSIEAIDAEATARAGATLADIARATAQAEATRSFEAEATAQAGSTLEALARATAQTGSTLEAIARATAQAESTRSTNAEATARAEAIRAGQARADAEREADRARNAEEEAEDERSTAERGGTLEAQARQTADAGGTTETLAKEAAETAEAEARTAEAQEVIARETAVAAVTQEAMLNRTATSCQLAAQALLLKDDQTDLALLLSLEANRIADTFEARTSLPDVLQANPQLTTYLHGHTEFVRSVAFSPDGQLMASGSYEGEREPSSQLCGPGEIRCGMCKIRKILSNLLNSPATRMKCLAWPSAQIPTGKFWPRAVVGE